MEMTIDTAITILEMVEAHGVCIEAKDIAVETMHKYQKIVPALVNYDLLNPIADVKAIEGEGIYINLSDLQDYIQRVLEDGNKENTRGGRRLLIEKHISVLQDIDKAYRTFTQEEYKALEYAIVSLKTDLKYDLMYEGEEVYTKADMVTMLEELKEQLREIHEDFFETEHFDEAYGVSDSMDIIQEKIEQLKGE